MNGDLRTVQGDDPNDGSRFPLYCLDGEWLRVCTGGSKWTDNSARVACRQLGYSDLCKFNTFTKEVKFK